MDIRDGGKNADSQTVEWDKVAGAAGYRLTCEVHDPNLAAAALPASAKWWMVEALGSGRTESGMRWQPPDVSGRASLGLDVSITSRGKVTAFRQGAASASFVVGIASQGSVTAAQSGNVVEINGTVTPTQFVNKLNAAPAGPITVKPKAGTQRFTVSGDFYMPRANVTIQNAVLRDVMALSAGTGFTIKNSTVHSFLIDGADDWTIDNCICDFGGVSYGPHAPFDLNGGSIVFRANRWKITNSSFSGCYVDADPGQHTEAWYIGVGNHNGLIQGNHFDDNGTTGHLFFTWWDQSAGFDDPTDICVTGNTFTNTRNSFHHIDMRAELDSATNRIAVNPNTNTWDNTGVALCADSSWERACFS